MPRSSFSYEHSRFDPISPVCIIALSIIGVFFIYSAQHYQPNKDWIKQIIGIGVGGTAYVIVSLIDYKIFLRFSHWIYVLALLLLLLVALLPHPWAPEILGAKRWLYIAPGVTIQPSEFAKFACLVIAASMLARSEIGDIRDSQQILVKMALAVSVPFLLILFQPDLGTSLVIPSVVFAQLYASNLSKSFFTTALAIGAVLVGLIVLDTHKFTEYVNADKTEEQVIERPHYWIPMQTHQRERVMGFLYPDKVNRRDEGWNREQSIISVGSGGAFGKGWLNGNQAQLGYLPRAVAHNDFIFSVLAEETGFLGSVVVVSLFGLLIGNSIRIATIARDRFGTLLVIGVATLFSVHVFVNIAMTIGMMPITGLPLPFLSHGGTFMVSCCVLQGLAQSVYRFRKEF